MRFWRIAKEKWALDKVCDGARAFGGRWNPIGYPVLYAGINIEICALEKFVHLEGKIPLALKLVSVDIPDDKALIYTPNIEDLPKDWASMPIASGSQEFGKRWIELAKHLVMLIPSAIIPESKNAVINTKHPAYDKAVLNIKRDFNFDLRMF